MGKLMFGFIVVLLIIVSGVYYYHSKKPPEMTLVITNNTDSIVEKIVFTPSGGESYSETCNIIQGASYTATLAQTEYYDIALIDTKEHCYRKAGCRWITGSATLTITNKDFVPQGAWDTLKKTLGL
jgi:hypothetical protein